MNEIKGVLRDTDMVDEKPSKRHPIALIKHMLPYPNFGRLLSIRLISQTADGLFQAGMATLVLFSPYHAGTPIEVALAFAVLLLPFTVVVPFVGPLLDRWNRRSILMVGNLTRAVIMGLLAVAVVIAPQTKIVFLGALIVLGVNRFILAALSAGLPHTLPERLLVVANSIIPTVGSIAALVGALIGLILSATLPAGPWQHVTSLILAALCCAAAGFTAATMATRSLGPTEIRKWNIVHILRQLADGVSHVVSRKTPALALGVMAAHRLIYGISMMMVLLISRNLLADPDNPKSGIVIFGTVMAMSFVGKALAIVVTPLAHRRMSSHDWIIVCLGMGAFSQILWMFSYRLPVMLIAFGVLGLGIQGAKIAVDTIVQRDTDDTYRGRAFSLYDMLFNAAFVGACVLAAAVLPITGWSPYVCCGCAIAYSMIAMIYRQMVLTSQQ